MSVTAVTRRRHSCYRAPTQQAPTPSRRPRRCSTADAADASPLFAHLVRPKLAAGKNLQDLPHSFAEFSLRSRLISTVHARPIATPMTPTGGCGQQKGICFAANRKGVCTRFFFSCDKTKISKDGSSRAKPHLEERPRPATAYEQTATKSSENKTQRKNREGRRSSGHNGFYLLRVRCMCSTLHLLRSPPSLCKWSSS